MKKIIATSAFLVVLLTAGVTSANAQVSIIINPPAYGYVNNGYVFYPGPHRGCGNNGYHYSNYCNYGNRGGYYNGWGHDYGRGRRCGHPHHHGGCR